MTCGTYAGRLATGPQALESLTPLFPTQGIGKDIRVQNPLRDPSLDVRMGHS
jgi:hypothetical protein